MNNINAHRYNYNSKVNNKRHRNENGRKRESFVFLFINDYFYVLSMFFLKQFFPGPLDLIIFDYVFLSLTYSTNMLEML